MNHENIINSTIIGNKKMTSSKGNKFDNINLNKFVKNKCSKRN